MELDIIVNKFNNDGYVKIKNFFTKKYINKSKINLQTYLEKQRVKSKKNSIHFAKKSNKINSVHNLKWSGIKKFQKNTKIIKIVSSLLNDKLSNFGAEVFAKPAVVGMSVPIHQDNYYWNLNNAKGVTVWIALDKSTKKNGALFYYKSSHKLGLLKHKNSYTPGSSQKLQNLRILKKYKKITPMLNAGDILIHHCLIVHGSKENSSSQDRTGLTIRYKASSSRIVQEVKKKYEKSLREQLRKSS